MAYDTSKLFLPDNTINPDYAAFSDPESGVTAAEVSKQLGKPIGDPNNLSAERWVTPQSRIDASNAQNEARLSARSPYQVAYDEAIAAKKSGAEAEQAGEYAQAYHDWKPYGGPISNDQRIALGSNKLNAIDAATRDYFGMWSSEEDKAKKQALAQFKYAANNADQLALISFQQANKAETEKSNAEWKTKGDAEAEARKIKTDEHGMLMGTFDERKTALTKYLAKNQGMPGIVDLKSPYANHVIEWAVNTGINADANAKDRARMFLEEKGLILNDADMLNRAYQGEDYSYTLNKAKEASAKLTPEQIASRKRLYEDRPIEAQWLQSEFARVDPNSVYNNPGDSGSVWNSFRDLFESGAAIVGNYYFPGSGLISSQLVSKGSQEQLKSDIGQIGMAVSGASGGINGNMSNYPSMPDASVPGNATSIGDASWSAGASQGTANAMQMIDPALKGLETSLSANNILGQLGKELITSSITGQDFSWKNVGTNLATSGVSNVANNFMPDVNGTLGNELTRAGIGGTASGLISSARGNDFGTGFVSGSVGTLAKDGLTYLNNNLTAKPILTGNFGKSVINNTGNAIGAIASGTDTNAALTGAAGGVLGDLAQSFIGDLNITGNSMIDGALGAGANQVTRGLINSTIKPMPSPLIPDASASDSSTAPGGVTLGGVNRFGRMTRDNVANMGNFESTAVKRTRGML